MLLFIVFLFILVGSIVKVGYSAVKVVHCITTRTNYTGTTKELLLDWFSVSYILTYIIYHIYA